MNQNFVNKLSTMKNQLFQIISTENEISLLNLVT